MKTHAPEGPILAIHSVVVAPAYRRKGLAARALRWYRDEHAFSGGVRSIKLIAKAELLALYVSAGFRVDGPSAIQHGKDAWFDCSAEGLEMVQLDAFPPAGAFSGNPAAVVFSHRSDDWMAKVANENNLSESAFLSRLGPSKYAIRWWTPGREVDLCGHATLAAAAALFETRRVADDAVLEFETRRAGSLRVSKVRNGGDDDGTAPWLSMDFPTGPLTEVPRDEIPAAMLRAVGIQENGPVSLAFAGKGPPSVPDVFIHLEGVEDLASAPVDIGVLATNDLVDRGVIVTCASKRPGVDFESRFFAPKYGVQEDPVTGSAHTLLTAYWESVLGTNGERPLVAHQASKRGGKLRVRTEGDRTIIQGQAAFVFDARLFAHPDDL